MAAPSSHEYMGIFMYQGFDHRRYGLALLFTDADYRRIIGDPETFSIISTLDHMLAGYSIEVFWEEGDLWVESNRYTVLSREVVLQPGKNLLKSLLPGLSQ